MSRKKFNDSLSFLKKCFSENEKALDLIEELREHGRELSFKKPKSNADGLILPSEVQETPGSFAVFSDGACRGNPGPGAWAVFGQNHDGDVIFESTGLDVPTTNNKMELQGAITGLEHLLGHVEDMDTPVFLYSDSKYVVDGISKWVEGWKRRGWKKADKKVPENVEMWKELDALSQKFGNLKFCWVRGHSGHPQNEHCDQLANQALDDSGF